MSNQNSQHSDNADGFWPFLKEYSTTGPGAVLLIGTIIFSLVLGVAYYVNT